MFRVGIAYAFLRSFTTLQQDANLRDPHCKCVPCRVLCTEKLERSSLLGLLASLFAMSIDSAATRLPHLQTLLNSMHATVPGHMTTFQVAAQLISLTQPAVGGIRSDCSSNLAQQLTSEVCTSTFGL
ncbi:hypothetical protein O6H91_Y204700 [Diphasiastrum complanatum]|nr:hypothetical protein O6H91_Y204700 [Diphasiastrum complanatum]